MSERNSASRGKTFGFISLDKKFARGRSLIHGASSIQLRRLGAPDDIALGFVAALRDPVDMGHAIIERIRGKARNARARANGGQTDWLEKANRKRACCVNDDLQAHRPMVSILEGRHRYDATERVKTFEPN